MADQLPRPLRNNNPFDIRVGDPWQGLMSPADMNPAQQGGDLQMDGANGSVTFIWTF